jgi:hypothetical protein
MSEHKIMGMDDSDVVSKLNQLIAEAGPDERRVLLFVADRLVNLGQKCYGKLDLSTDPRDGHAELNEELGDALVYLAFVALRGKLRSTRAIMEAVTVPPTRAPAPMGHLVHAAIEWAAQGPRSRWTTAASLRLYDAVQDLVGADPLDGFDEEPRRSTRPPVSTPWPWAPGPANFRSEAGQLVEDDDVPDEDR